MLHHLLPPTYRDSIKKWIEEDLPSTDIGGFVVGDKKETAHLYCKPSSSYDFVILSGVPFLDYVFSYFDLDITWFISEGAKITMKSDEKVLVARVHGKIRNILMAERTALNIISRASGVATEAKIVSDIALSLGWKGCIAGTRKTTPGFRLVEKYSLLVGGCATHRNDLSQMVMLKDNHIWSTGSITNAVKKAKSAAGFSIKIEVECQNEEEALEACSAGSDIIMLDNFKPNDAGLAAQRIKSLYPNVLIEVSGGINKDSLSHYISPHIDILSMGSLTQGYVCIDFSLKVSKATDSSISHIEYNNYTEESSDENIEL